MDQLRAQGVNPLELAQSIIFLAMSSGKMLTSLCNLSEDEDEDEDDDDEAWPDDFQDRIIGSSLDNILLGHLPIDDSGKLLLGTQVPTEMMTVGGTPILIDWDGEHLTLTDPHGTKATVGQVIVRGPKMLSCTADKTLMTDEWLAGKPVRASGKSSDLDGLRHPGQMSVAEALRDWDRFDLPSKTNGMVSVRSRLRTEGLRAQALEQQLFRVTFELPKGQLVDEDKIPFTRAFNNLEDRILLKLALKKPPTTPLAVLTKRSKYEIYYCAEDSSALTAALKGLSAYPFTISLARLTGDTALVLDQLVPPETTKE